MNDPRPEEFDDDKSRSNSQHAPDPRLEFDEIKNRD